MYTFIYDSHFAVLLYRKLKLSYILANLMSILMFNLGNYKLNMFILLLLNLLVKSYSPTRKLGFIHIQN